MTAPVQLMVFRQATAADWLCLLGDYPCAPCDILAGPVDPIPSTHCNTRHWPCHASDPSLPASTTSGSHEISRRALWLPGECAGARTRGHWRKRKTRKS